jgi:hypothetical protein
MYVCIFIFISITSSTYTHTHTRTHTHTAGDKDLDGVTLKGILTQGEVHTCILLLLCPRVMYPPSSYALESHPGGGTHARARTHTHTRTGFLAFLLYSRGGGYMTLGHRRRMHDTTFWLSSYIADIQEHLTGPSKYTRAYEEEDT